MDLVQVRGFRDCSWGLFSQANEPGESICACESVLRAGKANANVSETQMRARCCRPLGVWLSGGTNTSVLWACLNYQHNRFHPSLFIQLNGPSAEDQFPFLPGRRSATGSAHFICCLYKLNPYLLWQAQGFDSINWRYYVQFKRQRQTLTMLVWQFSFIFIHKTIIKRLRMVWQLATLFSH